MNNLLFNIEHLQCAYDGLHPVLEVNRLEIPRGKLIVLLGKSGAGKSTFLETLGLMNNTIVGGDVQFFPTELNEHTLSFNQLWKGKSNGAQADIRAKHMSFIFQNTNLMPNYGALENIIMAHLIKGNTPEEAKNSALHHMQNVNIGELAHNTDVMKLSGGQRQRLAFVRAISTPFSVIFGDEPTGNLDQFNSNDLMQLLRSTIAQQNASAIIVTHNIELALHFADMIVLISKNNGASSGKIEPQHILTRSMETAANEWVGDKVRIGTDPTSFIHEVIHHNKL